MAKASFRSKRDCSRCFQEGGGWLRLPVGEEGFGQTFSGSGRDWLSLPVGVGRIGSCLQGWGGIGQPGLTGMTLTYVRSAATGNIIGLHFVRAIIASYRCCDVVA